MKNQAATEKQAMKQQFDGLKEQFKAANALQMQREQQAVDVQKQREQSAAQAQEADKGRQADSAATLIDLVYDKKKNEEDAVRGQQQEELKAILQMLQDNTATQNKAILAMVEASLAERETEVAERDSKGKVKKTRSRVVKNG
jgi:hypothetical protein